MSKYNLQVTKCRTYIDAASRHCEFDGECSMSSRWKNLCRTHHRHVAGIEKTWVIELLVQAHVLTFSPVCVRKCRLSRLGRSNALPQYSHGNMVRSRGFFTTRCVERVFFIASISFIEMFGVLFSSVTVTSSSSSHSSLFSSFSPISSSISSSWRVPSRLADSGELGSLSTTRANAWRDWWVCWAWAIGCLVTVDDLRRLEPVKIVLVLGVDFKGLLRSSEYSSEENTDEGSRFSFWDENDEELEMDEVDSEGEASKDIDRSKGLSIFFTIKISRWNKSCQENSFHQNVKKNLPCSAWRQMKAWWWARKRGDEANKVG